MMEQMYVMSESLLDAVNGDEVTDELTEEPVKEFAEFLFSVPVDTNVDSLTKHNLENTVEKYKRNGYLLSYSIRLQTKPYIFDDDYEYKITAFVSNDDLNAFNCFFADVFCVFNINNQDESEYKSIKVICKNFADKDIDEVYIEVSGGKETGFRISNGGLYENCYGKKDFCEAARGFFRSLMLHGLMQSMDADNDRFFVYEETEDTDNFVVLDCRGWVVFKEYGINRHIMVRKFDYGFLPVVNESGANYIDKNGKRLLKEEMQICKSFENGYGAVQRKNDRRWNFVDTEGNFISNDWFVEATSIKNGVSIVSDKFFNKNVLGIDGNLKSKEWYDKIDFVANDNYLYVQRDYAKNLNKSLVSGNHGTYNIMSLDGKILSNDEWFKECKYYMKGYFLVTYDDGTVNLMKSDGSFLLKKHYLDICGYPSTGIIAVKKDKKKWQFIDILTEKDINEDIYEECWALNEEGNVFDGIRYFCVVNHIKKYNETRMWSVLDENGKMIRKNDWFSSVNYISNGLFNLRRYVNTGHPVSYICRIDGKILYKTLSDKYFFKTIVDGFVIVSAMSQDSDFNTLENVIDKDGKPMSDKWFKSIDISNGFIIFKDEDDENNIMTTYKERLIEWSGHEKHFIKKWKVINDGKHILVEKQNNTSNIIDKSGNLMFPKWTKDMIEVLPEGIIRIGLDNYVDCNGEIVLCV